MNSNSVMVVEDDQVVSKLLNRVLLNRGFSVKLAQNGREAIEHLENNLPPDLILLDIILPFIDGIEVLGKIRATPNWEKVPIVMLTSKTQEQTVVRAFRAGADDYVTKPFQIEELMIRVKRLMR
jgi:two-component system, OmpR family, alkaline phosphatase synthesis response regulator PhoP